MRAPTIDQYIEQTAGQFTRAELTRICSLAGRLPEKLESADSQRHPRLLPQVRAIVRLLGRQFSERIPASQENSKAILEIAVAASYLLKGHDLIPDDLSDIGFDDDAFLLDRVFFRNRPAIAALLSSELTNYSDLFPND